jgi:hypothetical protein
MDYDICLICLDNIDINDIIIPSDCNCKVKLHLSCLELIKKHNMLCPICRIKTNNNNTLNSSNNYLYDSLIISILIIVTIIILIIMLLSNDYLLRCVYYIYIYTIVPVYTCFIIAHVFYYIIDVLKISLFILRLT